MDVGALIEGAPEPDVLDFDEDFIQVDAAICEYDSVGNSPQRKGESTFQWVSIEGACIGLLSKANDIRVAIWYLRACMARRGVAGLAEGTKRLAAIMSLPAEDIHPRAQPGESSGEIQALHLGWIAGAQFLHQIGNVRLDGQDVTLDALAHGDAEVTLWDQGYKEKTFYVLHDIKDSFKKIEESVSSEWHSIDVSRVLNLLDRVLEKLGSTGGESTSVTDSPTRSGGASDGDFNARSVMSTREDVAVALERIAEYFRVHEPGHPAPIFLSRIQRMLGAGFEELMAELYPDGTALAAQLGGPAGSAK
nr:type VI secretion system ImpA family N-terminal domain-containing protein [Burkholderia cepacia]